MRLGEARTPEGMRLYAIGDVHGCDELLADVHAKIGRDLAARGTPDYRIIHIGDYVDRGPDSAAVIERLARMSAVDPKVICLMGNHDALLLAFLDGDPELAATFLANGGPATLASYDVRPGLWDVVTGGDHGLARKLAEVMPAHHRDFLKALKLSVRLGDFLFCHAGIRPGVPLEAQDPQDLIWIRNAFLDSEADFGVVVIHGHTPTRNRQPDVRANRIDIDTGAVFGGPLTCLVLDGTGYRFL